MYCIKFAQIEYIIPIMMYLTIFLLSEHPLMMVDFRGGGSEMTPINLTLECKNRKSGGWE